MRGAPVVRRVLAAGALVTLLGGCTGSPDVPEGSPPPTAPPSTAPSSTPDRGAPTAVAEPPPTLTLTVVGDVMLGRGVAARHPDPTVTLRPMTPFLRRSDVTVGTLESTLSTDGVPTQGGDSFAADPAVLRGLAASGFDALSLADNTSATTASAPCSPPCRSSAAAASRRSGRVATSPPPPGPR